MIGDLGERWDFPTLNRAFRLLMAEPRPQLVALGMTRYWRAPGGLQLDVAPFIHALEHATGARAVVLGKPAAAFYESALDLLGLPAADVVMVGDDVITDIDGAQKVGIRGVLVKTGKYRDGDLERGVTPEAVLLSLAAPLSAFSGTHGRSANSLAVAGGTKSAVGPNACCRSQRSAATGGVRMRSASVFTPRLASLSTSASRGREVVFVRKRWGISRSWNHVTASAAPWTGASPS